MHRVRTYRSSVGDVGRDSSLQRSTSRSAKHASACGRDGGRKMVVDDPGSRRWCGAGTAVDRGQRRRRVRNARPRATATTTFRSHACLVVATPPPLLPLPHSCCNYSTIMTKIISHQITSLHFTLHHDIPLRLQIITFDFERSYLNDTRVFLHRTSFPNVISYNQVIREREKNSENMKVTSIHGI